MITFYLGRSGVGKSYNIFKEIDKKIKSNTQNKLILIVPEQYTLHAEIEIIEKMKLNGLLDLEVISFNRLINRALQNIGKMDGFSVNSLGKNMLLRKIFDSKKDELKLFTKAYSRYGFIDQVSETISELKKADITPEILMDSIDTIDDMLAKTKMSDLSLIFNEYEKQIDGKYTDDEDKINHVVNLLHLWNEINGADIFIDGFSAFTEQEYRLIDKLSSMAKNVSVALTLDESYNAPDRDVFEHTYNVYSKIVNTAKQQNIPVEIKHFHYNKKSDEISHIESNFFSYPYMIYTEPVKSVFLNRMKNKQHEIECVCIEILEQVLENSYTWKDFVVVMSDVESRHALVDRIFSEYNIPYFVDIKHKAINNSFVRFVKNSVRVSINYFNQNDMLEILKSGYINFEQNVINELENYILKMGIKNKRFLNFDLIEEGYIRYYMDVFINPLIQLQDRLNSSETVRDYAKCLIEYLDYMKVSESINKIINKFSNEKNHSMALEYAQIWNKFIEVIDQMVEIASDDKISADEFLHLLDAGFEKMEIGVIPPNDNMVTIASINRSKSHEHKVLFLLGFNDGEIPFIQQEQGILSDDEKQYLVSSGISLNSTLNYKNREQIFILYQLLSKPTHKLYFSYSMFDDNSDELKESIYAQKLRQIFKDLKTNTVSPYDSPVRLLRCGKDIAKNKMKLQIKKLIENEIISDEWFNFILWMSKEDNIDYIQEFKNNYYYTSQVDDLSIDDAKSLYSLPLVTSTTKLERYVKCPFSYFVRYGLNPKERQLHKVKPPDIGLIFHKSLELFWSELASKNINYEDISNEQIELMLVSIVDKAIKNYANNVFFSSNSNKYLINKIKRVLNRAIVTLILQLKKGEFKPTEFELEFTNRIGKNTIPAILIETNAGDKIYLQGQIDRVDVLDYDDKKYIKIIDYKSANKDYRLSDIYNGLEMQLMIYMDAILENSKYFKADKLYPCGVFYFKVDDPVVEGEFSKDTLQNEIIKKLKLEGLALDDISVLKKLDSDLEEGGKSDIIPVSLKSDGVFTKASNVLSHDEFVALLDYVKNKISSIGEDILAGKIDISPIDTNYRKACDYCEYSGICQFDTKIYGNKYRSIINYSNEEVMQNILLNKKSEEEILCGRTNKA